MLNVYEDLGETSRRLILAELLGGKKSVGDLVRATGLKQPNVSNHLHRMRSRGIVRFEKSGRQVFYELADDATAGVVRSIIGHGASPEPVDLMSLVRDYAKAAVAGDENVCQEIMDRVFRAQTPLIDVYEELLAPAMAMVGSWYKVEAIDEAQEHMASSITERILARAVQITGPAKKINALCVLGCAPQAWHVIGLRMIADFLKLEGWRTLYLGANVPIPAFLNTVQTSRPTMILLSCGSEEGVGSTVQLIKELRDCQDPERPWVIGIGGSGAIAHPARMTRAGADFIAKDLRSFADQILPEIERSGRPPVGALSTVYDN